MNNNLYTLITVAIIALVTVILRSFAFFAFPEGKKVPSIITKLGNTLPYGIMMFLIVYCLKDVKPFVFPYGIPEAISVLVVVLLQLWRKNSLLSVLIGTACYMILVQVIFV